VALNLPIRTERLVLRRLRDDDRTRFLEYRNDPETARHQGWPVPYTATLADELFAEMTTAAAWRVGEWFQIAIEHDAVLVGDLGVRADVDHAVVGYTLHPEARGRGFATEAVRAIAGAVPVPVLVATVEPGNRASMRVLERAGFVRQPEPVDGEIAYKLAIEGVATFGP